MRLMKRILLGTACSLLFLMNHTEAQTMNNSTEALSPKERQIAAISAHTARGDMDGLKTALAAGLDAGLSLNEIREVLVQMYAYCGFPRSLNALSSLMELSKERAARGINDREGAEAGAPPAGRSIEFGTENQTKLCGAPVKGELFQFAPAIDEFLKAHLFGDIFGRDNLDWKTRELATIAALASMKGTESQLNSHIRIGKYNGLTDEQVDAILNISGLRRKGRPFPEGQSRPRQFHREGLGGHDGGQQGLRHVRLQRHLCPRHAQQLAQPFRGAGAVLHGGLGLLPGTRQEGAPPGARQRGGNPGKYGALARSGSGQRIRPHRHYS